MRRRILLLVVGMTTLVVLAFAIPLALLVRSAVADQAQTSAVDQANTAASFLRSGNATEASISNFVDDQRTDGNHRTWIITPDGDVIGSPPGGALPPSQPTGSSPDGRGGHGGGDGGAEAAPRAQLRDGFGGRVAEVTVAGPNGASQPYQVFVWISPAAFHDGEYQWWVLLVVASVGLIALSFVGGELVTRRLVRPLEDSAETARRISAGDLAARASTKGPKEVAEVGTALNQLADRIDELVIEERETVADMSHRMRTPLTALRLDAEALGDPEDAERIGAHVSALERTLTAVIRAARRPQREGRVPAADATYVVAERVAFWSALTDEQRRQVTVSLPSEPVFVRCAAEDLAATVDALVENVVAHTPEGSAFAVTLRATDDGALLQVADDGPGLPDGVGVRGRSDRGSTGLGLSIARQCAEASGGSMATGRSLTGGAIVVLHLGPAAAPAHAVPTDS
jgi:signal transduction histidine kinase